MSKYGAVITRTLAIATMTHFRMVLLIFQHIRVL